MKTFINIKKAALGVALAALLSLTAVMHYAEAKRAIILSPTSQKIVLIPGETYRGSVRVTNPSDSTENLNYSVAVGSYSVNSTPTSKDDYGEANIDLRSDRNEIMNWITVDNPSGVLAPNEEQSVGFTINVPSSAPAGGQYATLLVKDNVKAETKGDLGIAESIQMASVIYAEVAGEAVKSGEIKENKLPSFLFNNELEATALVRNTGNVHTDAEFILQVWPLGSNEELCTNEEDSDNSLILPDTERYHTQTCKLPNVGIFRAKQTVKIFDQISTVEKTIFVCPIWLLFLIIFVVIAIVLWVVLHFRNKGKKSRKSDN